MIKLETHIHTKGGSGCAHVTNEEVLKKYLPLDYKALCVTNHYAQVCYDEYVGRTHKEKIDFYFSLVDSLEKEASKFGVKVFWGAETRAYREDGLYSEYMIYGMDRKFIYDNKPLFYLTQQELKKVCDKNGFFIYQTHPFRVGVECGNPSFVNGVEVFNGHPYQDNNNDKAVEFAKKYNLKMMSGTDLHNNEQPVCGGIYIPENINTNKELAGFLLSCQPKLIMEK